MALEQVAPTLRDQLASALDATETRETPAVQVTAAGDTSVTQEGETPEQAAARLRDDKGRFAASDKEKPNAQQTAQDTPAPGQRPARPSTWKKDYWDHWDKIDPKLAEYLVQREGEYASGISTYRQKWTDAEPLVNAIAPFQQTLQQYGIQPAQWIQSLGHAQHVLALGTPEQKLHMFTQLANQYQIPLQSLLQGAAQPGADGQPAQTFDPRVNQLYQQLQQVTGVLNDFQTRAQKQEQEVIDREINAFKAKQGNEHYEQVRQTMAGLLQSGLADDLQGAYDAALRHPRHADIYAPIQQRERAAEEAKQREAAAAAARTARAAASSVRTTTPSTANGKSGGKDIRSQLSDAYDELVSGRV